MKTHDDEILGEYKWEFFWMEEEPNGNINRAPIINDRTYKNVIEIFDRSNILNTMLIDKTGLL